MQELEQAGHGSVKVKNHKVGGDNDPEAFLTGKGWFEKTLLQGGSMAITLEVPDDTGDQEADASGSATASPALGVNKDVFLNTAGDEDLDLDDFSDDE